MSGATNGPRAPSLDHVGFVGDDLARLVATMQRLGFSTTEPKSLMRTDPDTGAAVPLRQQSCHAVFAEGYVELSAVLTDDPAHHLAAYRARGEGLHILALGSPDPDADWRRCSAAGLPCSVPAGASRGIDYGSRHGEARFRWFMLQPQASPEGLLCLVRNETPELVFQPEVSAHANGTEALSEVIVHTSDLAALAGRLSIVTGNEADPIGPGPAHGQRYALDGGGHLTLLSSAAMKTRFGAEAASDLPTDRFAGLQFRVRDVEHTAALLAQNAVPFTHRGRELIVPPRAASGAILAFRE
jgi:hypothetical protein